MMTKNAYAFVVIEKSVMVFKHTKDEGLMPIFEGFVPLKEGFLKSFKERCNLEFLENLDLLFLYDYPFSSEIFSLCKELKNSIWDRKLVVALVEALEGFKGLNLSLKIEDKRSNSLGNGAKKLLTNADLGSNHKAIVIDSMKTYHQSQQEKYKRERGETLEEMLKIAHDLENLEQETQYEMRKINEQLEEAKYLEKQIHMNFHSPSEIDRLMREAKEHEREAKRRYDEYLKDKDD